MKKLKKAMAAALAAMTMVSAMSMTAFATANTETKTVDPNVQVVAIDENGNEQIIPLFYDEEAAALSEQISKQRSTIPTWNWNNGYYTTAIWANAYLDLPYVFAPTSSGRIGVDSILYGCTASWDDPCISVNDYTIEQSGTNGYIGSFYYDNISGSTYEISYVIRGLTPSHKFRFSILGNGDWDSGNISIQNRN